MTVAIVAIGITMIVVGAEMAQKGITSTFVVDIVMMPGGVQGHYEYHYSAEYYLGMTIEVVGLIIVPSAPIAAYAKIVKDRGQSSTKAVLEALDIPQNEPSYE